MKLWARGKKMPLVGGKCFKKNKERYLAGDYYIFSLRVARDPRHTDLWAAGVGWIALLHIYWGQSQQALPLLQEAQRQELHNQRLRSWLSAIEAEVQAKLGNADECFRCLDKSKNVALPISLADDVYRTGFNQSRAAGYEGSCCVLLRQPERALLALNEAATLCSPTLLHRRSIHLADRGAVYAPLGDRNNARALTSEVLDVTEQSKSLIGLQKVFKGRKELDPWKESGEVKNLDARLRDLLIRLTKLKEQVH